MGLRDRIIQKSRPEQTITIDGDAYLLIGLSELDGSKAETEAFMDKNKSKDAGSLRREILVRSLHDPETRTRVFEDHEVSELESIPRHITAKLFVAAMQLSGYDKDDAKGSEKN